MAEDFETDPETELEAEEVASEGQRWARQEYTQRFWKTQHAQTLKELEALIGLAGQSSDPRVAAAHARYLQSRAVCDFLTKASHGDDFRYALNMKAVRIPKERP